MKPVIAILMSDLHLSHTAPAARAAEPDWYKAQKRGLVEVGDLMLGNGCPLVIAGDIFDRWNAPAETINFALMQLPQPCYTIKGQHDLPNHNDKEIYRSAYWTLHMSGKIFDMFSPTTIDGAILCPFPWGKSITPPPDKGPQAFVMPVAVIHRYCYADKSSSYPGAPPPAARAGSIAALTAYKVAHFGDNHKSFTARVGGCNVFNPGTFYCRKSDERDHRPMVGLLHPDGTITPHYLDTSQDRWVDPADLPRCEDERSVQEFLDELAGLAQGQLDFRQAVREALSKEAVSEGVRSRVLRILEEATS